MKLPPISGHPGLVISGFDQMDDLFPIKLFDHSSLSCLRQDTIASIQYLF